MALFQSQLIPFEKDYPLPLEIRSSGKIKNRRLLDIEFILSGSLSTIVIDEPILKGRRSDELWKKTCFEIFVKDDQSEQYWEYNLSPSSNWAIYGFDSYRHGRFDEHSIEEPTIKTQLNANELKLECTVGLPPALFDQNLNIGLSSVVQDTNGNIYYYALKHTDIQPDFHARESFIVRA